MNNRVRTVIARKVKTIVEPLHYLAYVVFGDRVLPDHSTGGKRLRDRLPGGSLG